MKAPSSALLMQAFLPVVHLMLRLDDHGAILAGCQTLKAFIRAGGTALATERPDGTNSAAHLILQVVARVLTAFDDEYAVGSFDVLTLNRGLGRPLRLVLSSRASQRLLALSSVTRSLS